jgi:hypothetical protein
MKRSVMLLAFAACSSGGSGGGHGAAGTDAATTASDGKHGGGSSAADATNTAPGDGSSHGFTSTLTSPCATLQGRAIVNYNGNLGIAFTDSNYAFLGSVQFELPDGFTGEAPNPEDWDGTSPRHVIAMTDAGEDLHGNHCWNGETPPAGTLVIQQFDTTNIIVNATFDNFAMHSCTDDTVCTVSGTIVTNGSGVFD